MAKQSKEMVELKKLLLETVYCDSQDDGELVFMINSTCEALVDLGNWIKDLRAEREKLLTYNAALAKSGLDLQAENRQLKDKIVSLEEDHDYYKGKWELVIEWMKKLKT